jgi:ABC-type nickel/cobalt efflux system permease component RcnA
MSRIGRSRRLLARFATIIVTFFAALFFAGNIQKDKPKQKQRHDKSKSTTKAKARQKQKHDQGKSTTEAKQNKSTTKAKARPRHDKGTTKQK